jgi:glycine/D-amino acid oxidase-like deaminating enzyme
LRFGRSYWLDHSRHPAPSHPYLRGRHEADVVIIGGGITGCACAFLLARRGVRTILVDAGRIGHGSTAASTALIMQEPDVDFRDLAERYDRPATVRMWKASRRAVRDLVGTLAQLGRGVTIRPVPSVYFTSTGDGAAGLARERTARHRAGLQGRWLSPAGLKRLTGIEGGGAIVTPGNAEIDPLRSCFALARAAAASGAQIYSHSRARRVRTTAAGVEVDLDRGAVRASRVIVATGYATPEFKPLSGRFRMSTTYVIGTPRLSRAVRNAMGLGQVMLWDTERPYHYARWTPDHRLLFGGRDRPHPGSVRRDGTLERRATDLAGDLAHLYPALAAVEPDYAWEALFASTPDGLPYIGPHRRYPHHLFALGYAGNGMSFGFLAAQVLARAITAQPHADDELFSFSRHRA